MQLLPLPVPRVPVGHGVDQAQWWAVIPVSSAGLPPWQWLLSRAEARVWSSPPLPPQKLTHKSLTA